MWFLAYLWRQWRCSQRSRSLINSAWSSQCPRFVFGYEKNVFRLFCEFFYINFKLNSPSVCTHPVSLFSNWSTGTLWRIPKLLSIVDVCDCTHRATCRYRDARTYADLYCALLTCTTRLGWLSSRSTSRRQMATAADAAWRADCAQHQTSRPRNASARHCR